MPFKSEQMSDAGHGQLYEIIGTTFWNDLMPLVRYRTGDLVRLPENYGASARSRKWLSAFVRSAACWGASRKSWSARRVCASPASTTFRATSSHILRIQVIQESLDDVRILVLPAPGYTETDAAQLLQNARAKVPETMQLRIETAQWLERTPRGKTPLVIHRKPVQDQLRRQGVEPAPTR